MHRGEECNVYSPWSSSLTRRSSSEGRCAMPFHTYVSLLVLDTTCMQQACFD